MLSKKKKSVRLFRDTSPLRVILSYKYTGELLSHYCQMFCNLNRFLLASKKTGMTGQFPDILRLVYSRFKTWLIYFEICRAAYSFPSWRRGVYRHQCVTCTWYVAWHQHRGNNRLWRQNYSVEFCARWWIIGSINPSNKFFVCTKQTNSLTWMILSLDRVQWKSLWPYNVVWLEIAWLLYRPNENEIRKLILLED